MEDRWPWKAYYSPWKSFKRFGWGNIGTTTQGREEGREEGELSAKLNSIPRLSVLGLSVEQIAQALDLEIEQVQQVIEGQNWVKTDSIFYRLFQTFPESFFDLLNLPSETVNHYQFSSLEVKQLAFRLDGVFLPDNLNDPIYFVEVQFQKDERFYSRFFSEIFLYFHQSESKNN